MTSHFPSFLCVEVLSNGGDDSTVPRATPRLHRAVICFVMLFAPLPTPPTPQRWQHCPAGNSTHNADSIEGSCCLARRCPEWRDHHAAKLDGAESHHHDMLDLSKAAATSSVCSVEPSQESPADPPDMLPARGWDVRLMCMTVLEFYVLGVCRTILCRAAAVVAVMTVC